MAVNSLYVHDEVTHNNKAAEEILPMLFQVYKPGSVLDVGCGLGTWLKVSKDLGVPHVLGIDGDYVNRDLLRKYINEDEFKVCDLTKPFQLNTKYDLALCLEVAEHLPKSSADTLIESLTLHSDHILFSAAIPAQGGQNHLNEQWQSYWMEKFKALGYTPYDLIRPLIWENTKVDLWYRQNIVFYSKSEFPMGLDYANIVVPDLWLERNEQFIEVQKNLSNQLLRLKEGKVGFFFYLKGLFKSLKYFGLNRQ